MASSNSREAVVFVRINNMDTLQVERQETFVVEVSGEVESTEVMADVLYQAALQARPTPRS